MERHYYTLKEAARKLSRTKADLIHMIETDQVEACLKTTQRRFIISVIDEENNQFAGIGTVWYRGLLKPHSSRIKAIIEDGKAEITGNMIPLGEIDSANLSSSFPFKEDHFPHCITYWRTSIPSISALNNVYLAILPDEKMRKLAAFAKVSKAVLVAYNKQGLLKNESPSNALIEQYENEESAKLHYFDYENRAIFTIEDIRITQATINDIVQPKERLPWCDSIHSPVGIDRVIERVFLNNQGLTAKEIYRILESADQFDSDEFDKEGVISCIGHSSIEWRTASNSQKELKFSSFANKITKIRKFYANL